jgi:hypothetical protein
MYRQQIALGLDGDPRAALKARVILRELFGGKIRLVPDENGGKQWDGRPHPLAASVCQSGSVKATT